MVLLTRADSWDLPFLPSLAARRSEEYFLPDESDSPGAPSCEEESSKTPWLYRAGPARAQVLSAAAPPQGPTTMVGIEFARGPSTSCFAAVQPLREQRLRGASLLRGSRCVLRAEAAAQDAEPPFPPSFLRPIVTTLGGSATPASASAGCQQLDAPAAFGAVPAHQAPVSCHVAQQQAEAASGGAEQAGTGAFCRQSVSGAGGAVHPGAADADTDACGQVDAANCGAMMEDAAEVLAEIPAWRFKDGSACLHQEAARSSCDDGAAEADDGDDEEEEPLPASPARRLTDGAVPLPLSFLPFNDMGGISVPIAAMPSLSPEPSLPANTTVAASDWAMAEAPAAPAPMLLPVVSTTTSVQTSQQASASGSAPVASASEAAAGAAASTRGCESESVMQAEEAAAAAPSDDDGDEDDASADSGEAFAGRAKAAKRAAGKSPRAEAMAAAAAAKQQQQQAARRGAVGGPRRLGQRVTCRNCGAQQTPQWRCGPEGPRTLCNACGVRYKKGLPLAYMVKKAKAGQL